MRVFFKNGWFAPNMQFFEKGEREVPDELVPFLAPGAKVLDAAEKVAGAEVVDDLTALDLPKAAADAEAKVEADAEARRLANAKRVRERLAAETKA